MTLFALFQGSFVVDYLKCASLKDEPDSNHNVTASSSYGQEILVHWHQPKDNIDFMDWNDKRTPKDMDQCRQTLNIKQWENLPQDTYQFYAQELYYSF